MLSWGTASLSKKTFTGEYTASTSAVPLRGLVSSTFMRHLRQAFAMLHYWLQIDRTDGKYVKSDRVL